MTFAPRPARRLRVVHIAATANGALWMHEMLRELAARGHDVSAVIAGRDGSLAPRLERDLIPYDVLDLDAFSSRDLLTVGRRLFALVRLLRRLRPDIVHYHLFPSIVLGRIAGWLADVPVRFSMIPGPYYLEAPILGEIEARTAWADTRVIASCEHTRTLYVRHGVSADRLDLIYYGPDERSFDPACADGGRVRRELGLAPETPTVGIVAYFYPPLPDNPYTPRHLVGRGIKAHDVLLRAVPRVLARVPDATFLLVGEGWGVEGRAYEVSLRALATELGVAHAVRFVGVRSDIPDTLAAFDVSVQCSLSENLGGSLESLLMARPLVASAVGGLVDGVRHEETGLLVAPDDPTALADAIIRLLTDRPLAARLAARGRAFALEHFTLSKTVDDLEAIYTRHADEVCAGRAGAPNAYGFRLRHTAVRSIALPRRTWQLITLFLQPRRAPASRVVQRRGKPLAGLLSFARLDALSNPLPRAIWRLLAFVRPSFAGPTAGVDPSSRVIQLAGGTENAQWLVDICRQLRQHGYDVSAIIGAPEGDLAASLRAAGVPYRTMRLSFAPELGRLRILVYLFRVPIAICRLAYLFRKERAAVVHTHIFNSIFIGRLAAWLAGVPCRVSMVPGPLHLDAPLTRWADRRTWWMDHRVVAGSEWTRHRYLGLGLRAPRLACIGYGVDPARFDPAHADPARIRRELGLDGPAPIVGLVAYFYPPRGGWHTPAFLRNRGIKGHEDFIEAARLVRARRPDARFLLVGSGWGAAGERYRERLMALCRDEELGDAVIFTGLRRDIPDLISAFDVAVQCSLSENYGGTIESLLMETPTVATRVGGMPETVRDGETGLLVPPADPSALAAAILALLDEPGRARAMAGAGRRLMLERFQIARTADSIAALYEQVLYRSAESNAALKRSA